MTKVYITSNVIARGIIEMDIVIAPHIFEGSLELTEYARKELKTGACRLNKKDWFTDYGDAVAQANKNVKAAIKRLKKEADIISYEIERLKQTKF